MKVKGELRGFRSHLDRLKGRNVFRSLESSFFLMGILFLFFDILSLSFEVYLHVLILTKNNVA